MSLILSPSAVSYWKFAYMLSCLVCCALPIFLYLEIICLKSLKSSHLRSVKYNVHADISSDVDDHLVITHCDFGLSVTQ